MLPGKFIFSHMAVFATGAVIAVIFHRADVTSSNSISGEAASSRHQARASGNTGTTGETAGSSAGRRNDGRQSASDHAAGGSPAERLANIVRIGDPFERQTALMGLIGRLAPGEFAAIAEQYRNLDHFGNSRGEYDLILRGWANADPVAALEFARKNNSRDETALVLSSWASGDPAAAERWALSNHEGDGANPFMASVISGIAVVDLAHASRLAEAMPFGRERSEAVDAITRALFVEGTESALAYPATIRDPQLRGGFVAAIASRLARKDADQAASWLASNNDPENQSRAARTVAEALARTDPASAASWVPKLSPEARAEAALGIIPIMSSGDIAGTAQWVSGLAGIPDYDRVVEEFVWSCDQRAPEQSAAWIQGIADPAQQTRLYHRMLGEWARRDADAVKQWVAQNPVPDTVARRFNPKG